MRIVENSVFGVRPLIWAFSSRTPNIDPNGRCRARQHNSAIGLTLLSCHLAPVCLSRRPMDSSTREPRRWGREVPLIPIRWRGRFATLTAGEDTNLRVPPAFGRVDLGPIGPKLEIPAVSANALATAGEQAWKSPIRVDSAWQACGIRSSLMVQPQHSGSSAAQWPRTNSRFQAGRSGESPGA